MANEDTSEKSPQPDKKRKVSWIIIVFVTVGVVALGAAIIIPQFSGYGRHPRISESAPKADLHNLYLACHAYWVDNGPENNCTPAIAPQQDFGYIQSVDVTISASGTKTGFSATAQHIDSTKTFHIDSNGTITEVD